jgi:5'-3' exonuclease
MKLLIDGDILVYTLGYASESKGEFADGTPFSTGDFNASKSLILNRIIKYCDLFVTPGEAIEYEVVLSGKGNYRYNFYPNYKSNRVDLIKPMCYDKIRKWMVDSLQATIVNGEEADDYLAAYPDPSTIIISADKDFYTTARPFYSTTAKRLFHLTIPQSICFLFFQALAGDRVDGYYGVKWLGVNKVRKLLKECSLEGWTIGEVFGILENYLNDRDLKKEQPEGTNYQQFLLCLDLAALRWEGEIGEQGIGLLRIHRYGALPFEYCVPHYDPFCNLKFGTEVPNLSSKGREL